MKEANEKELDSPLKKRSKKQSKGKREKLRRGRDEEKKRGEKEKAGSGGVGKKGNGNPGKEHNEELDRQEEVGEKDDTAYMEISREDEIMRQEGMKHGKKVESNPTSKKSLKNLKSKQFFNSLPKLMNHFDDAMRHCGKTLYRSLKPESKVNRISSQCTKKNIKSKTAVFKTPFKDQTTAPIKMTIRRPYSKYVKNTLSLAS